MNSKLAIALPITCIAMLATGQVWLSHTRYETSLETSKIQKAQSEQKHEIHKLELELASLTRPERLRKIAQSELGMAPPRPMQVLRP
ncbi:MAG: cell division protein FtsL [Mariprofundaceae bacterium]